MDETDKQQTDARDASPELSLSDISETYRKWATECMEEHAQLMDEFDGLCNVIKL